MDDLNERITETRVALTRLETTVEAHERRDTERHRELLAHLAAMREDHRQAFAGAVKITLSVIGVLSTAIAGYFGVVSR